MNKERRKKIEKAADTILDLKEVLEEVRDEEEDAHLNLPESLQNSERGEQMQEYVDILYDAITSLDEAQSRLEDITG